MPGLPAASLAERMRPRDLADLVGQEHLLGPNRILGRLVTSRQLPSLLLWGPPGCGKTTLALLLAQHVDAAFVAFSAVLAGVKEIRQLVAAAEKRQQEGVRTVLFVDEIHRFNKAQQDAFLPHVESGLLTLIGATTENPSFHVIAPLLSRSRVLVLSPLAETDLDRLLTRALQDREHGLGQELVRFAGDGRAHLLRLADGDGRRLLNTLEVAVALAEPDADGGRTITPALVEEASQRKGFRYDRAGEEHYNLISALHKSLRDSDPDAGLYWLARMLAAGEDPLFIARRLIRFASEDVGNAEPQALMLAVAAREAFQMLGSPEGELALAQCAVYLATAPKSNAVYRALGRVRAVLDKTGSLPVPLHLRNAPTRLMADLGYGAGYQYAHDAPDALVPQAHLPEGLPAEHWYEPTNRGHEAVIRERLTKWRALLARRSTGGRPGPERRS
ncbi:MAG: replication-associated recombination protein A [Thermodesulfobacteriota bacterium]